MLDGGFNLVGEAFGGADLRVDERMPSWLEFMNEISEWTFGSAYVRSGGSLKGFGRSRARIDERLASVGVTYDDVMSGARSERVEDVINGTPWLWGFSEARRAKTSWGRDAEEERHRQASIMGVVRESLIPDVKSVYKRFASFCKAWGFVPKGAVLNMPFVLHRPATTGIGVFLAITFRSNRMVPFPAWFELHVMPDIDYMQLDPAFAAPYRLGLQFHSLTRLGMWGAYATTENSAELEVCLRAHETFLEGAMPTIIGVCDGRI